MTWRDLRNVVLSYDPDEGEGYLPLIKGEQVIVLHTDTSGDTVWYYGEAADDCSQRGWFPSMVCDGYCPSRRAAAEAEKGGGGGRGRAAPGGPGLDFVLPLSEPLIAIAHKQHLITHAHVLRAVLMRIQ